MKPEPLARLEEFPELGETLLVSSWNVWFDRQHRDVRFPALLAELATHRPHLMAFQEVTTPFLRAVKECSWLRPDYWISGWEPSGVLLLGRVRVASLDLLGFPSDMGRRLLLCQVNSELGLATCHLESTPRGEERRKQQLEMMFGHLSRWPRSLAVGDFNFADDSPLQKALPSEYADLWKGEAESFTVDSTRNRMLVARGGVHVRQRIDRMMARGLTCRRKQLLGVEPIAERVHPSDHFGLLAEFLL